MFTNYLKTSFRNFQRHRGYTFINLFGLAVGLSSSIFIFLWILDEVSYDKHHTDHQHVYAVIQNEYYTDGSVEAGQSTSGALAEALVRDIPEVQAAARSDWGDQRLLRANDKSIMQQGVWADTSIFNVLSYPLIEGDARRPMPDKNSIVITKAVADKFFPEEKALGKIFRVDEQFDMRVTAVIENLPFNSQLKFDFLTPYELHLEQNEWKKDWDNYNDKTFVKLTPQASFEQVNKKLEHYISSKCSNCNSSIWLQPYSDVRLYNRYENGKVAGGRIEYIRVFAVVAIFIVLIACINFMNLATARSATRSREAGIRKVVGAQRKGLIIQFIGESITISMAALLVALAIVQIMLPFFNQLTEKQVQLDFTKAAFTLSLISITFITGVLAGSYPAFFLSSFRPVTVLKGNTSSSPGGSSLRKILVVFQFAMSIILIVSSMVILKQVGFIRETNLGFDRQNILTFDVHDSTARNKETFKTQALAYPSVKNITFAGQNPFKVGWTTTGVSWPGKEAESITPFKVISTDNDFIPTMNMTLLEGRNFDNETTDSTSYIVNETALQKMGMANPVGQPLSIWKREGKIIGVVKDFNNSHLQNAIEPLVILCRPESTWRGFVKIESNNVAQTLASLAQLQKAFDPNYPTEFRFLDDQYQEQYKIENTIEKISLYFTVIAIVISCLGLFGLASFTAERRTKELGVRKILGASVPTLIRMLCADFTRLVFVALAVGCPIAYYLMSRFLSQYAYHAELSWNIFMLSAIGIVLISLLTVIYQATKAALNNPVESLRNE